MSSKRKLKTLTFAEKLKVIEAVKSGLKRKNVAAQFGIHESTLSLILKKENDILKKQELGESLQRKRLRLAEFPQLEQCLFTWFKQCRNKNISVSGPILKEIAEEFAKSLGIHTFRGSNGWLEKFKKRHDLAFKKVCGEHASVSKEVCQERKCEKQCLVNSYNPNDVFNSDETGAFSKCLSDKTLTFKNDNCHGEKHSKEQLKTLCVNSIDTEKLKPQTQKSEEDFKDESQDQHTNISVGEARTAVNTLWSFIGQCSKVDDNIFSSLFNIENLIDIESMNYLKQKQNEKM